ncbi:MAG TPA: hypothetical protein VGK67_06840 [Myxococcales bacterium]|jgi:hypothetical protein
MRHVLVSLSLAGAVWLASCDFEYAYQQYCDDNPACAPDSGDAGTELPGADASLPDAASPDPACHPEVLTPGVNGGPGGAPDTGLDSCQYEENCDSVSERCEVVKNGSCGLPARKEGPPAGWGPIVIKATPKFLRMAYPCYGNPATEVTISFYAPNPIYKDFKVFLRPPPWDTEPQREYYVDQGQWPTLGDSVGTFVLGVCDLTDWTDWSVGLADTDFMDHPRRGNLMCLSE